MKSKKHRVRELFEQVGIDFQNAFAISDGGSVLDCQLEIRPEEFLQFAERDISSEGTRGLVNGLSNAKRAIDAQVDKVLRCLWISPAVIKKNKLDALNEIGLVAPRIIKRVRDTRHLLEHEYRCPTKREVEDAIDVATLFVAASSRMLWMFPDVVQIANKDQETDPVFLFKKSIHILRNWDEDAFAVSAQIVPPESIVRTGSPEKVVVANDEILYYHILRLYVAAHTEKNVREALDVLRDYLS